MRRSDFHYTLPPELIAQHPLGERSASRLLVLDAASGALADRQFADLPALLLPGDLLVLNDTRVIPARLYGHKLSGGRVEILVERIRPGGRVLAHVRASKPPPVGAWMSLEGDLRVEVVGREAELYELRFDDTRPVVELLEQVGHVPLPPYIRRPDEAEDRSRYQTVFARRPGAVAAPTAGLHFDQPLFERLDARGVERTHVTLHVGAGTFQPVRTQTLEAHHMHAEHVEVGDAAVAQIRATQRRGGRVIAVGTTVVRALEAAAQSGEPTPLSGDTELFIYPGYRYRVVDAMITNFHLPESSLLMLVCAFGGYDNVMGAYRHAVAQRYRFYSYGDAMFIAKGAVR